MNTIEFYSAFVRDIKHVNIVEDVTTAVPVSGPWVRRQDLYMDYCTGECLRVDEMTDIMTEEDILAYWPQVEAADRKEIQAFVDNDIFRLSTGGALMRIPLVRDC